MGRNSASSGSMRGPARPSSTVGNLHAGRTARKSTAPRRAANDVEDDNEAGTIAIDDSTGRRGQDKYTIQDDAESDESSAPEVAAKRQTRSTSTATPAVVAAPGRGGKGRGKAGGGGKGRGKSVAKAPRAATGGKTIHPSMISRPMYSDDSEDAVRVRSVTPAGYPWEVEVMKLSVDDFQERIRWQKKFKVSMYKLQEAVTFEVGDIIWVCPDPKWLTDDDLELVNVPDDLEAKHWWLGHVVNCGSLLSEEEGEPDLGFLKIRWFYNTSQLKSSQPDLYRAYGKSLREHKFKEWEFIYSDHYDLISLQCYGGHAPGFFAWVEIKGLEVPQEHILLPEHLRPANVQHNSLRWVEGFGRRKAKKYPVVGYNQGWDGKGDPPSPVQPFEQMRDSRAYNRIRELDSNAGDEEEEEDEQDVRQSRKRARR